MGISQVYEGDNASFSINAPASATITVVRWTINGIPVNEQSDLTTVITEIGGRIVDLMVNNVSATFNGSIITCTALINNVNFSCSPDAILQVQGTFTGVIIVILYISFCLK